MSTKTPHSSVLRLQLERISPFLTDPETTEVCINRPGSVFVETRRGWQRHDLPDAITANWIGDVARAAATAAGQHLNAQHPILSSTLPDGERLQVVIPPAVDDHDVGAITIRRPDLRTRSRSEYEEDGLMTEVRRAKQAAPEDVELSDLYEAGRYWDFLETAVKTRKNIVISGATGSGKTMFTRALINYIPTHERIITLEDTRELFLPNHPNRVHLLFSEGGQGQGGVSAKALLQSALRMKPDRILLSEVRSRVAYDYIVTVSSGHPGSITTVHAESTRGALEMLMLRVKESPEGQGMDRTEIMALLRAHIDIIVQLKVYTRPAPDGGTTKVRRVSEIHYERRI